MPTVAVLGSTQKYLGRSECLPGNGRRQLDAVTSTRNGFNRGRRAALAGQSLYTDAEHDQVHLECSGGYRCSLVATEHFRTIPLFFPNPRWGISKPE